MQVLFFGALLSAIKSTASATLLAPQHDLCREHLAPVQPRMSDQHELKADAHSRCWCSAAVVLAYAIVMQGTSIYEMVSGAYQVTLVGAFVPLVFGLYWKRATTQGAVFSVVLGLGTWLLFWSPRRWARPSRRNWPACWPPWLGMAGRIAPPQRIEDHRGRVHHFEEPAG